MSQTENSAKPALDLSAFLDMSAPDGDATTKGAALSPVAAQSAQPTALEASLAPEHAALREPMPKVEKLVSLDNLPAAEIAAAQELSKTIDFSHTATTIRFVDNALAPIAKASRQLLADTTVGEAGEVGRIAAAVIDGIKILRIEDLQKEAHGIAPKATGFMSKVFGGAKLAGAALKGFQENRKKFTALMDKEEARARKAKADLELTIQTLDEQALAVRQGVGNLTRGIAAAQIALERGEDEFESLRQKALKTGSAADAAAAMDHRNTLANFRGKIADLQESMISAATLIPIIGSNRKAAETRVMKLSNGVMLTIPRLMALASQAVVQADANRAGQEAEKLSEANRQLTALAGQSAHDAAVGAAKALGGDDRNLQALSELADQTIATMKEVLQIEQENLVKNAEREQELIRIRNNLVAGMRSTQNEALSRPLASHPEREQ